MIVDLEIIVLQLSHGIWLLAVYSYALFWLYHLHYTM